MRNLLFVVFVALAPFVKAQSIFSTQYESQAEVTVFVVDYESQADLLVHKVKYASQADIKIFFVDYESKAGWNNKKLIHHFY